MQVTLRSDDSPDVIINANECVRLLKLDQHIRTLQTARRWLIRETKLRRMRETAQAKQQKISA
jgi:hypothetical protein